MKILNLVLLIILLSAVGFAQSSGSVTGRVTDDNEAGINQSQVKLTAKNDPNTTFTARADSEGNYRFDNIPAGVYQVAANNGILSGAARGTRTVTVMAGQTVTLNITVQPFVSETVTIASGTSQPVDQVSKSVSTISGQEMERRNEQTVADALRTLPGITVQQSGGFGRLAVIKTRGLRNQDTAVMIDGQRFRDAGAITGDASPFISDLVEMSVRKIEVLRGSGSSLYGTNAIGGVINILTDDFAGSKLRGSFMAEGGSLGMVRGKAGLSGGYRDKAFFNLGLSHNNYKDGVDGNDGARNTSGKAGFRYQFNHKIQLTSRFYISDAFVQLNINPDTIGPLPPITTVTQAVPLSRAELKRYENGTPIASLNGGNANFIPDADDPDFIQRSRFYNFHIALDGTVNEKATYRFSYQNLTTKRRNIDGPQARGLSNLSAAVR